MNPFDTAEDLVDQLTAEYIERCRNGAPPDPEAYVNRHPELADTIRDLFPMIAALELMKRDDQREIARTATQLPLDLEELGDFEIIREIGRGGMGIVYEAQQQSLGRRVALKILPKQALLDPAHLKRFEREARIVARLHHTNVVSLYGAGEYDGYHFLAMELVQGESLSRLIQKLESNDNTTTELTKPLQHRGNSRHWDEIAKIGRDAALGLQHAHERGVLHRDITPGNLLMDELGNVMLSDFGMARIRETQDSAGTQTLGGTLCYLAPEIFSGQFDERSDVFGLGVTLYELVTLKPAFADASPAEAMKRIADQSFRPIRPREVDMSLPLDLETIILKAMADQPQQRYATASELAEDLQRFLERRPIQARRSSVFEHAWRWCRRNQAVAALSTLALMSLIALSILMTFSFIQARSAKLAVESALVMETKHRQRLDATVNVATNVLNNIYREVVSSDLQSVGDAQLDAESNSSLTASPMLSDDMVAVLDNLLEFYDQLAEQGGDNQELMESSASALTRVADIYRQLGQPSKAMAHYTTAIKTLDQLKKQESVESLPSLQQARIYNEIGRLHYADDEQKEAIRSHQRALRTLEDIHQPTREHQSQVLYETARAHYFLGRKRSIDAAEVAADHLDDRRPPRMLPWLRGPRPRRGGSQSKRRDHLRDAIATIEKLPIDEQHRPENQFLLACCYREFSNPLMPKQSADEKRDCEKARQLLSNLVERFAHNPHYRYELVETLRHQVGEQPQNDAELQQTQALYSETLGHVDNLTTHHPNVPLYAVARMHALHRHGHVLVKHAGKLDDAKRDQLLDEAVNVLENALAQTEALVKRWPDRPSHHLWHIVVGGSLGKALLDQGDSRLAADVLSSAIEQLNVFEPTVDRKSRLHRQLTSIRRALGKLIRRTDM